jgi:hypothetical protein
LLAEALCALALSGVLAAAAATALLGARKQMRAAETRDAADRAARETIAVLRHAIENGRILALRGDTAIDLDLSILIAPVCAIEARAVVVPPSKVADHAPPTAALQPPLADDIAAFQLGASSPTTWDELVIDSVQIRTTGECGFADAWADAADAAAPRWRVRLRDTVATALRVGDELRVGRTGRFTLYHAGSGEWMLGWRRCAPITLVCGVVQPVAGPLRPPAAGGLHITAHASPSRFELEARGAGSDRVERATVFR